MNVYVYIFAAISCRKKSRYCDSLREGKVSFLKASDSDNATRPKCSKNSALDHLVFENVNLFYDKNGDAVLSDVSFKIPAGQKVCAIPEFIFNRVIIFSAPNR